MLTHGQIYFLAWAVDFLIPTFSVVMIALIVWPKSRGILFPPAPMALVSSTGGVQKPKAGVLGSHDSATGAPENHKGEAVEAEASNFVTVIASVALSSATGKHPQGEQHAEDGEALGDSVPDPSSLALAASNAKHKAAGAKPTQKHDKTKVPMETAMWTKMRPIMHGVADVADTWERFGNALSPTAPFPKDRYRLRLASVVVPMLAMSIFVSSYMVVKGLMFGVGFGFFGDPLISRGLELLNRTFPHWEKLLELRNTLLKGVPTNAQLAITLMRIGEANRAPLPPPPQSNAAPPNEPAAITDEHLRATGADWPLSATKEELDEAMQHDPTTAHETSGADIDAAKSHHHGKHGSRILNFFKGTTKATIKTAITADTVKAKAGSTAAKNRLGVVPRDDANQISGPIDFKCRYNGNKGHVYVTTRATIPCIAFSTDSTIEKIGSQDREDLHPAWSIAIGEIKELKKLGGYGWKAKLVVGWALNREVKDGLEIVDRAGNKWVVTAMALRNELFNRLCSIGGQKWESW